MFINTDNSFKNPEDYTIDENKIAQNIIKYAIVDAFMGGVPKADFLQKNIGMMCAQTSMRNSEIQEVVNALFSAGMKIAFSNQRNELGFNSKK
jgi:hypothetical protein